MLHFVITCLNLFQSLHICLSGIQLERGNALPKNWQIGFKVKGLGAPEKEIVFNDYILVRGVPWSDSSYVFFKFPLQNEEEKDKIRDDFINVLRNIAQVYGLVTNVNTEVLLSSVMAEISSENPFGHTKYGPDFGFIAVIEEEQRKKNVPLLEKTMTKYESVKSIFQNRNKAFLRNAVDYYHRSLGDLRLEEKLIDLTISLESLFSTETQELRLRISLRASSLLSVGQENEQSNIFRMVYRLYDKRSKVVHGTEVTSLDGTEISRLQTYVRESIQRFIHIEMPKKRFLGLLDEAVYDTERRKLLCTTVKEAIKKW